jgi:gliotoxin/aspirochlorine biosynthesis thioredoxin reductase
MVTIFTNGPPDESAEIQEALDTARALGMKIESRQIQRLKPLAEGLNVLLEDGDELYMGFLVHAGESVPMATDLIASIGLEMADTPFGKIIKRNEPFGSTNISGVFSCGDVGSAMKHVTQAMSQGKQICRSHHT